jgi:hypothetical protein
MILLEYISYAILLFFTITWIIGIRKNPGVGLPTVFGALLFFISSILLPLLSFSFYYSFFLIPLIFFAVYLSSLILGRRTPIISSIIEFSSNIFMNLCLIGIDKQKYHLQRKEELKKFVENWLKRKGTT